MRSASPYRRPSPLGPILFGTTALVLCGLMAVFVLWSAGVVDLPFLHRPPAAQPKPNGVPVPLAARAIPAFTRITRDHILNAQTLDPVVMYLPAEEVAKSGFLTFEKINGRVLNNDKPAGFAFTERDFLPPGTRPGLVAGVPHGKVSFVLDAERVEGVAGLKIGDHVDLMGTVALELDKALGKSHGSAAGLTASQLETLNSPVPILADAKVLARDALVVLPMTTREIPLASGQLDRFGKPRTRPVQEITLAVAPEEVAQLTEAQAYKAAIVCVAHSGLPNEPPSVTPSANPGAKIHVVEDISGKKRDFLLFGSPGQPPRRVPVDQPTDGWTPASPGATPAPQPQDVSPGSSGAEGARPVTRNGVTELAPEGR